MRCEAGRHMHTAQPHMHEPVEAPTTRPSLRGIPGTPNLKLPESPILRLSKLLTLQRSFTTVFLCIPPINGIVQMWGTLQSLVCQLKRVVPPSQFLCNLLTTGIGESSQGLPDIGIQAKSTSLPSA